MTASWLTWQITWRSTLRLLGLGALFGAIYGPVAISILIAVDVLQQGTRDTFDSPQQLLAIALFAALVGASLGAPLGIVMGILVGLLISAITIRMFLPLRDPSRYMQVIRRSSTAVGALGTLVSTPLATLLIFGAAALEPPGLLALFSVGPALLACLAIWWASGRIAAWYVRAAASAGA
jgi:hypothetical protein